MGLDIINALFGGSAAATPARVDDKTAPAASGGNAKGVRANSSKPAPGDGVEVGSAARAHVARNAEVKATSYIVPTGAELMHAWREDVVYAHAQSLALEKLEPMVQRSLVAAQSEAGRPLSEQEAGAVRGGVYEKYLDAETRPLHRQLAATKASKEATVQGVLGEFAENPPQLMPFLTRVAQGDPKQLARETVVFSDANHIVVAEPLQFIESPKVLVLPTKLVTLPTELSAKELDALAACAGRAYAALAAACAKHPAYKNVKISKQSSLKVNPPQWLTQQQLHVHVQVDAPAIQGDAKVYDSLFALMRQELAAAK